jgi:catechol 2,3-dioxygenase-like lactoylglutathione lyase family enzyme
MAISGRFQGIQHVALPFPGSAQSVEDARRFYGSTLGLAELPVPEELAGSVLWFAIADQELHLFAEPSGVAANSESRRHLCLEVDDLARCRSELGSAGLETIAGEPAIPGRPRFFVIDPFGNAIEFVELEEQSTGP